MDLINERGVQAWVSRKTGICFPVINQIFKGHRRATAIQAALLEEQFLKKGIPIGRWDLLYGVKKDQTLSEYAVLSDSARRAQEREYLASVKEN